MLKSSQPNHKKNLFFERLKKPKKQYAWCGELRNSYEYQEFFLALVYKYIYIYINIIKVIFMLKVLQPFSPTEEHQP